LHYLADYTYLLMFVIDVLRQPSPPIELIAAEPSPDEMTVQVLVSDLFRVICCHKPVLPNLVTTATKVTMSIV